MFEPVDAHAITFRLHEREDMRARKVKLWERDGKELKEVTHFWWPDPAIDDIGGGGIYANVQELLKIYLGVLQGKLLRPETVKMMFQPCLENRKNLDSPEAYDLNTRNAIYNTVPNDVPSDYGLGGLINTLEVPGRRSQNSLTWSGLPNCYWWVDIEKGVAGVYLSQLLPTGDQRAVELLTEFERAVYSALD
ncbi:hypothetical protein NW754_015227 [Fusarium falciforme]|nr:hypothetical protein NW754_015227 [Fusarium falciforme]